MRPDVAGASSAIALALADAGMSPRDIHYINAHGTATHANDITESEAILAVFGDELGRAVPVSSTKPVHGHALGAGGGLELSITISALREQIAPPTINFLDADPRCPIDAVPNVGAQDFDQGGHVQLLRLRRHQRRADRAGARS